MHRLTLTLNDDEKNALWCLADKEFREPRSQAALMIRLELQRLGLMEHQPSPKPFKPLKTGMEN